MTTPRQFELTIIPEDGTAYGIEVGVSEEGSNRITAKIPSGRVDAIRGDIVAAVVSSGHRRTVAHVNRKKPIALSEEAGVRLTLVILSTAPIKKSRRIDGIRAGVDAMTSEEVFYWYAHITGHESARALMALRILLAGE